LHQVIVAVGLWQRLDRWQRLKLLEDQQTSRGNDDSRWDDQEHKEPVARFFRHAVPAEWQKSGCRQPFKY
jgi:hypothetical protein